MIKTENLCKRVPLAEGELEILKGIELEIKTGEAVAIVGESGSGKSTLLGLMAGLDAATEGEVWVDGAALGALDEDQRARLRAEKVGFVFQFFHLLPALTARENVMLPLELRGSADAGRQADAYLERVGLGARLGHYPKQLSGGEQQRVAIARAFAGSPAILFADEPTGNLDTATGARIIDLLFAINKEEGATLVLVTHEQRLAARCDRCLRLDGGMLIQAGEQEN